jgi:hypothetical protein
MLMIVILPYPPFSWMAVRSLVFIMLIIFQSLVFSLWFTHITDHIWVSSTNLFFGYTGLKLAGVLTPLKVVV